ncbi:MAG: glycosyltransferase family 2 protein, partial [Bacteroidota bacterium]
MSIKAPLISILMPVFNAGPYLEDCLNSIIKQSYTNWELLAINDHSTDQSRKILENFSQTDPRIQFSYNDAKGIIPALRKAYQKSQGSLITRMDADDLMPLDKLEKMTQLLLKHGPGCLATGLVEYFSDEGLKDGYRRYAQWLNQLALANIHYQEIYRECVIPSPCWMLYRLDLDRCGAFQPNQYPEDYDLVFRFYKNGIRPAVVPEIMHLWRDHSQRSSRTMEVYAQQAYFDLKVPYFLELDRKEARPLLLWGAGRKGKRVAQLLIDNGVNFHWIC